MLRASAVAALAGLALSSSVLASPAPFHIVVRNSDPVPGVPGAAWSTSAFSGAFLAPNIDAAGRVAFRGTSVGTGGGDGFWYGTSTDLTLVSAVGQASFPTGFGSASNAGNTPWAGPYAAPTGYGFLSPNLTPNGTMVIGAFLAGGVDGPIDGIYDGAAGVQSNASIAWAGRPAYAGSASTISILRQQGDVAPGTTLIGNGPTIIRSGPASLGSYSPDNQGRVLQVFDLRQETGALGEYGAGDVRNFVPSFFEADAFDNSGALYYGGPGSMELVLRTGTNNDSPWNKRPDNSNIVDYSFLPLASNGQRTVLGGLGPIANNGAGESAFTATLRRDGTGGFFGGPALIQGNGGEFFPGINGGNDEYVLRRSASGALSVVVREGDAVAAIPGARLAPGGFFGTFSTYGAGSMNNSGRLIFGAPLENDGMSTAITPGVNDFAVFAHDPVNGLIVAARSGDAAPRDGGDPFDPVNIGFISSARLNNASQMLWSASLAGAGVTPGVNDNALILSQLPGGAAAASQTLLLRQGDAIPGLAGAGFGTPFSALLNNAGQVVFNSTPQDATGAPAGPMTLWSWDPVDGFRKILSVGDVVGGIVVDGWQLDTGSTAEGTASALSDSGLLTLSIASAFGDGTTPISSTVVVFQIPAPSAAGLLGVVGMLAARRRRR